MKRMLVRFMAFLSYWCGIDALFYRANQRAKRIITFHSVLPDVIFADNLANGVSCSASSFRAIVRELRKNWRFSTDLSDPNSLTLTFDDGYLNQYEVAGKILQEEGGIPAMVFVAGDVLSGKTLVVDKLLHWVSHAPDEIIRKMGFESPRKLWSKNVWPRFLQDSAGKGMELLKQLNALYPYAKILEGLDGEYRRLRLQGMNDAQCTELRARGWVVGWHTKSHYPVSRLSYDEKKREIAPLDEFKNVPFSFPYGELQCVDAEAIRVAREYGYPSAVSNVLSSGNLCGRYFLPRMSLPADKYLLHFELSGLKYFLKSHKLLPKGIA